MELVNNTPFVADRFAMRDTEDADVLVIVVKCTYDLRAGLPLTVSEEQSPIQMADEFWGNAGETSVRYESDLAPTKTGTDVVLHGHAYAAQGQAHWVEVSLRVGTIGKTISVFGNRQWVNGLSGPQISAPEPFDRMPLVYELAYGGSDVSSPEPEGEERNPVGRGFRAKKSHQDLNGMALPNLEDPMALIRHPSDRPAPAGFGFFGRHWLPRRGLAGTFDQAWTEKRSPFLPGDFSEDYFNGGSPGLVARPHLLGHEPVEIINASVVSPLRFQLPGTQLEVRTLVEDFPFTVGMRFDTLVIEPDLERLMMVWRGVQPVQGRLEKVEGIEVSTKT